MRPDGTRVRDLTAIMQALPYVMPKRYDAQNWAEENLDEDAIRAYIREKRRAGQSVPLPRNTPIRCITMPTAAAARRQVRA